MTVMLIVILGLLGLAVGSFLNVCIDRLPAKKSLAYPPSHCNSCGHVLSVKDLVPVFSYLRLRGKCRYCGARIPVRVPLVESAAGLLFSFLFWKYGLTYQFALVGIYSCVLLVLAVIDLEHRLILNVIVYPVAIIALIADILIPGIGILSGLGGGAIGFGILLIPAIVSRRGMGWGNVKMAGLIGLMTGYPRVFVAILSGIILGGLTAVALLLLKKKTRKDAIPFGPFLSIGSFLALLWGQEIIRWYLNLLN
ncbi:MAG: prepilin peptidase [Dehalococcoidia bacterium]|nr:prepilin peptidase [Dehalococcoidia bacterium]